MAVSYQDLEAQVLAELNAIDAVSATAAETVYQKTGAKSDSDVGDQAFFLSRVRSAILDAQQQVIRYICRTEGHPRRILYRLLVDMEHRAPMPFAMAYGAVYTGTGNASRELIEVAPEDIGAYLNTGFLNGVAVYYYAKSGNVFLSTVSPVKLEIFDFERPVYHPANLSELFDDSTDLMAAPDEFAPAIVHMACGHLALTAGSFQEQANAHFQVAANVLEGAGVKIETGDFGDVRTAQKASEKG